ncbi:MAG: hypothetical protein ACREHG_03805 [Candidatus Saccharimonadales bacterium]
MPKRKRNYQLEYAKRNARAQLEGYSSYGRKRVVQAYAPKAIPMLEKYGVEITPENLELTYEAFGMKSNANDYGIDGPKAIWFVELASMMSEDEWEAKYGG